MRMVLVSNGEKTSNTLSSVGKLDVLQASQITMLTSLFCSLEKEPSRRATPWRMVEHPWILEMKSKRVNMQHFLAKVWGWKE